MYISKEYNRKSIIIQLFFARKICVCHKSSVCTIARINNWYFFGLLSFKVFKHFKSIRYRNDIT